MINNIAIGNYLNQHVTIYDNVCEQDSVRDTGIYKINLFNQLIEQINNNNPHIVSLDIRSKLTIEQFKILLKEIKKNNIIQELTLRKNSFDNYDLSNTVTNGNLMYFLKNNVNLKSLVLYHTGIDNDGAIALSTILKNNNIYLKNLKISGHKISEKGYLFLIEMLTVNRSLEKIEINYNGINGLSRVCLIAQLPFIYAKSNIAGYCDSMVMDQINFNETFDAYSNSKNSHNYNNNPLNFKFTKKKNLQTKFLEIMSEYGLSNPMINRTEKLLSVFKKQEQQLIDSYPVHTLDESSIKKSDLVARENSKQKYINIQYQYIKHIKFLENTPKQYLLTDDYGPELVTKKSSVVKPVIFSIIDNKPIVTSYLTNNQLIDEVNKSDYISKYWELTSTIQHTNSYINYNRIPFAGQNCINKSQEIKLVKDWIVELQENEGFSNYYRIEILSIALKNGKIKQAKKLIELLDLEEKELIEAEKNATIINHLYYPTQILLLLKINPKLTQEQKNYISNIEKNICIKNYSSLWLLFHEKVKELFSENTIDKIKQKTNYTDSYIDNFVQKNNLIYDLHTYLQEVKQKNSCDIGILSDWMNNLLSGDDDYILFSLGSANVESQQVPNFIQNIGKTAVLNLDISFAEQEMASKKTVPKITVDHLKYKISDRHLKNAINILKRNNKKIILLNNISPTAGALLFKNTLTNNIENYGNNFLFINAYFKEIPAIVCSINFIKQYLSFKSDTGFSNSLFGEMIDNIYKQNTSKSELQRIVAYNGYSDLGVFKSSLENVTSEDILSMFRITTNKISLK